MKRNIHCILCHKRINGYGNNPMPLKSSKYKCCDECNTEKVIPARLLQAIKLKE